MKSITHKFRRLIQSYVIYVIKSIDYGREKQSAYELDCLKICKKLISRPDSTLLLTPITNKRYIKNDGLGIFITIEGSLIKVINHKYSYVVPMSDKSIKEVNLLIRMKNNHSLRSFLPFLMNFNLTLPRLFPILLSMIYLCSW